MIRGLLVLKSTLNKEMEDYSSSRLQCSRFRGFVFHLKVKYPRGDPFLSTSLVLPRFPRNASKTKKKQNKAKKHILRGSSLLVFSVFCADNRCWCPKRFWVLFCLVMLLEEFSFCLSIMSVYICMCKEWHFKGTIPWSIIPWSLLGKLCKSRAGGENWICCRRDHEKSRRRVLYKLFERNGSTRCIGRGRE